MKTLLAVLLLVQANLSAAQTELLNEVRTSMRAAYEDEATCERLLARLAEGSAKDPLIKGYHGVLTIALCTHRANPFTKLGLFNDGKDLLEEAVKAAPTNIELRFLRLTIQANAPGFLGYAQHLAEDKAFIETHLRDVKSDVLRKRITDFIVNAKAEGKI